jgi:hypothetical protein
MGRLDEAQSLLEAGLERQKRLLGPHHPDALTTARSLDSVKKARDSKIAATKPRSN